mmetsp:Transcript_7798/g.17436  ORF Transcript_7798/g.17436 Transcript_7798/m.17436 type:complete len:131 (-) Transcript_7798:1921-2313(-)
MRRGAMLVEGRVGRGTGVGGRDGVLRSGSPVNDIGVSRTSIVGEGENLEDKLECTTRPPSMGWGVTRLPRTDASMLGVGVTNPARSGAFVDFREILPFAIAPEATEEGRGTRERTSTSLGLPPPPPPASC